MKEIHEDLTEYNKDMRHILIILNDDGTREIHWIKGEILVNKKINKHREYLSNPLLKDPKKRS